MRWTIRDIAAVTGGRIESAPGEDEAGTVTGVSIDSRTLRPGELFVAVRAGRDGHDFAADAVAAGAGALLVEHPIRSQRPEVVVGDSSEALLRIGRAARSRLDVPVVGITGSVGKTSTKDMAAAALAASRRTVASPRSFNNELGLPLTLANAPEDAQVVVLEMGSRGPGHISLLCEVARPSIGVVTSVAAAHTEMFGDLEAVAKAKGELIRALPDDGTAILNGDDRRTRAMASLTRARSLIYTTKPPAAGARPPRVDVAAEGIELDAELRPTFQLRSPWGSAEVRLEARGAHQVGNALAALSAAGLVGVDMTAAAAALREAPLSPFRMEVARTSRGALVINDAYNANPASMEAALRALAAVPADRRVAVVGPMAELGESGPAEHRAVARLAAQLGVELIAVGTPDYGAGQVAGPDDVVARLGPIGPETAVLVKASRIAALETVAARIREGQAR